jgi:hydroxymethylbilane synthase
MPRPIKIGTRGSKLALAQAGWVADRLRDLAPRLDVELEVIDSRPRLEPGNPRLGDGIFVRQIQNALLRGEVTLGVHSLKDLPTAPVEGLAIGAIPSRADPRDCLVGSTLAGLEPGASIGTSSPRRSAQIRRLRPDLRVVTLNGNIPTRIDKMVRGECDAAMLAAAGLGRLGISADEYLPLTSVLPAPGQGALAVEMRSGETELVELLRSLHDESTAAGVRAERAILRALGGGCLLPVSALGRVVDTELHLESRVLSDDGTRQAYAQASGDPAAPEELGAEVAEELIRQGARELLESPA